MDFRQLDRGELIAVPGGAILGLSVFLAWYFGWWIGLVGGVLILIGSVWRTKESMNTRKPPGLP